jgi:small subunit ribosomal protein S14
LAKKCKVEQTKRCARLVAQHKDRRDELVALIKHPDTSPEDRENAYRRLARMPRDASATRLRRRCDLSGRPRGYMRKFRLSRITFRDLALEGKLPGVTKSSW